jgi:hypothetical protein
MYPYDASFVDGIIIGSSTTEYKRLIDTVLMVRQLETRRPKGRLVFP